MNIIIPLVIGLIAGGITMSVLLGQLKSVVQKREASDYVNAGSFKLDTKQDLFLYKQTERQAIQRQQQPQGNRPAPKQ